MEEEITYEDLREIIKNYYKTYGPVTNALNSYHAFMQNSLPNIIKNNIISFVCMREGSIYFKTKHVISFGNVYYSPPKYIESVGTTKSKEEVNGLTFTSGTITLLTPMDARLRKLSYSLSVYVDIYHDIIKIDENNKEEKIKRKITEKVFIGDVPVMVKSMYCATRGTGVYSAEEISECPMDPGGYFIIKGGEKVIITQERMRYNHPMVFKYKVQDTYTYKIEIRCTSNTFTKLTINKIWINYKESKNNPILTIKIPYLRKDLPLGVLLKAYGIVTDKDVFDLIMDDENKNINEWIIKIIKNIINDSYFIIEKTEEYDKQKIIEEALYQIGYYSNNTIDRIDRMDIINYAKDLVYDEILCHIGTRKTNENCIYEKKLYLGYMLKKLIYTIRGDVSFEDRDNYENKRIENINELFSSLFNHYFRKMIKEMKSLLENFANDSRPVSIGTFFIKPKHITQGFIYHISNGVWTFSYPKKNNNMTKTGIATSLSRLCYASTLSHLNRTNVPIERQSKLIGPRKLQPSRVMKFCIAESPDGASIGLINNTTPLCRISIGSDSKYLMDIVYKYSKPLHL